MVRAGELLQRHRLLAILAAILMLCLVVGGLLSTRFALAQAVNDDSLSLPGTVVAARSEVLATVAGKVANVSASIGSRVVTSQTLAVLSNPLISAKAELAHARLAAALAPFAPYRLSVPASGTVLRVYRGEGSQVMSGDPILAVGDPTSLCASVNTSDINGLPAVGQTAWVHSGANAPVAAIVDVVDMDHVRALLAPDSGLRLDDPVEVRFDVGQPGDPVVTYRGVVTGNALVLRARGDGQVVDVAAEGDVLAAGSKAATVNRTASPDATQALAISEAREAVRVAEEEEAALTIVAPTTGAVSWLGISVGQSISAGDIVAQVIGENGLQVKLAVDGSQRQLWAVGSDARIIASGGGTTGTVLAAQPDGAGLLVVIELPAGTKLLEGQQVMVAPALPSGAVVVPLRSIGGAEGSRWVRILSGLSGVKRHAVTLLAESGQYAVVSGIGARSLVALAP